MRSFAGGFGEARWTPGACASAPKWSVIAETATPPGRYRLLCVSDVISGTGLRHRPVLPVTGLVGVLAASVAAGYSTGRYLHPHRGRSTPTGDDVPTLDGAAAAHRTASHKRPFAS